MKTLEDQISTDRKTIHHFLTAAGFKEDEISSVPPQITDAEATTNTSSNEQTKPTFRYSALVNVLLRSSNVDEIRKAMEKSDQLVQSGVALGGAEYTGRAEFLFTGINKIKSDMIEEACTQSGRKIRC